MPKIKKQVSKIYKTRKKSSSRKDVNRKSSKTAHSAGSKSVVIKKAKAVKPKAPHSAGSKSAVIKKAKAVKSKASHSAGSKPAVIKKVKAVKSKASHSAGSKPAVIKKVKAVKSKASHSAGSKPAVIKKVKAVKPKASHSAGSKPSPSKYFIASLSYRERELKQLLDQKQEEKMILKDMEGRKYCLFENCDYPAIIDDYCRIHFFGLFKKISRRKAILEQKILEKNYQELARQHSTSFLEFLFKDLSSNKNFKLAVKKIVDENEESLETEDEASY